MVEGDSGLIRDRIASEHLVGDLPTCDRIVSDTYPGSTRSSNFGNLSWSWTLGSELVARATPTYRTNRPIIRLTLVRHEVERVEEIKRLIAQDLEELGRQISSGKGRDLRDEAWQLLRELERERSRSKTTREILASLAGTLESDSDRAKLESLLEAWS